MADIRSRLKGRYAIFIFFAVLVIFGFYMTGNYPGSPCQDTLAFTEPDSEMSISYKSDRIVVNHTGETPLTAERTKAVYLLIDHDQNQSRLYLVNSTEDLPITAGTTFELRETSFPHRIEDIERVRLYWLTYEKPLPTFCRNSRGGQASPVLVDQVTIADERAGS